MFFAPDYDGDGVSSWWEWSIDGVLYAADFAFGGPTGESLVVKGALKGALKGAGKKAMKASLKNVKKLSDDMLKRQGLNPHVIKAEFLGDKNLSKFDL